MDQILAPAPALGIMPSMHTVMRGFSIAIVLCLLLFLTDPISPLYAQEPDRVAEIMSRMSVEDKVGQLFIVSFDGQDAYPDSDIWQLVTEYKVGGVVLFSANRNFNNDASAPRQIAELNNTLQTTAFNTNGLPLFIAIDHEGDGYPYSRLTNSITPIPSQMALGATWDVGNAEVIGQIVGQELSAMGINMILGPTVDVLNDPRSTGRGDIGTRVFGGDPFWVSQMGRAYIRGIHTGSNGRMVTVAKHFPGHGGSDRLPDNEVATVDKSLQELRRIELPPFFHVTANLPEDTPGMTDALMSSHIRYRGFQGDIRQFTAPISFDADGMKTLLALPEIAAWHEAGGLIISDALGVEAVRKHFDPSLESFPHRRIAKEAFMAGNDVLILSQFALKSIWSDQFANIKDTIFFFRTEYINNPIFAERVDATVARILQLKLKLYPEFSVETLNVEPGYALEVAAQPRPVVNDIALQSLTLLYPSLEELRIRLPGPPRSDENILIVTDARQVRECYSCEPTETLPRTAIEETILRLYGPGATGQIQPERLSSITFSELKLAMGSAMTPPEELAEQSEGNAQVQLSPDEVRQRIQAANWIIFAMLDLNISRYGASDALKLFLAQEGGTLRGRNIIVFAFNAPYYLDTTEITKLTAYVGAYSKTRPHLEAAVRALFGEAGFPGAPPVTVEGIGYRLADVLAPDPDQNLQIKSVEMSPESGAAPVSIKVQVGPLLDYNGRPVPDGISVEIRARLNGFTVASEIAQTQAGLVEAILQLAEPGETDIVAIAGPNLTSESLRVTVLPPPVTPTPLPVATDTPDLTDTPAAEPATTPVFEVIPTIELTQTPQPAPFTDNSEPPILSQAGLRRLDGVDLLSALSATLLAGLPGFWIGQRMHRPLSGKVRLSLWILVGGLLAYLLYGVGWLRPEEWFLEEPNLLASRVAVAGLAFVFSLAALGLSGRGNYQRGVTARRQ